MRHTALRLIGLSRCYAIANRGCCGSCGSCGCWLIGWSTGSSLRCRSHLRLLVRLLLAGLILAVLNFVNDGSPGRTLPAVAGWFGLNVADGTVSRFIGFLLLIVFGGVFGLLFGFLQRDRVISLSQAIGTGLVVGAIWWFILVLILGSIMHQGLPFRANLGSFLSFFLSQSSCAALASICFRFALLPLQLSVPRPPPSSRSCCASLPPLLLL